MPIITLSVPEDLKNEMNEFKHINWSAVARKAITEELSNLSKLTLLNSIISKSKLSEEEAEKFAVELGRKIKKERAKELKKRGLL